MNWQLAGEIAHQETFAEGSKIRELHRLIETYGGKNWKSARDLGASGSVHLVKFVRQNYTGMSHMA